MTRLVQYGSPSTSLLVQLSKTQGDGQESTAGSREEEGTGDQSEDRKARQDFKLPSWRGKHIQERRKRIKKWHSCNLELQYLHGTRGKMGHSLTLLPGQEKQTQEKENGR